MTKVIELDKLSKRAKTIILAPCPFCYGDAVMIDGRNEFGTFSAVECAPCGAGGAAVYLDLHEARAEAAKWWNRRGPLTANDRIPAAAEHIDLTDADLAWLESEKFTLQPNERPQENRAAHNARIDRILAAFRRAIDVEKEERGGLRSE